MLTNQGVDSTATLYPSMIWLLVCWFGCFTLIVFFIFFCENPELHITRLFIHMMNSFSSSKHYWDRDRIGTRPEQTLDPNQKQKQKQKQHGAVQESSGRLSYTLIYVGVQCANRGLCTEFVYIQSELGGVWQRGVSQWRMVLILGSALSHAYICFRL